MKKSKVIEMVKEDLKAISRVKKLNVSKKDYDWLFNKLKEKPKVIPKLNKLFKE